MKNLPDGPDSVLAPLATAAIEAACAEDTTTDPQKRQFRTFARHGGTFRTATASSCFYQAIEGSYRGWLARQDAVGAIGRFFIVRSRARWQ